MTVHVMAMHALVSLAIKSLSNTTLGTSVNSLVFTCSVVPVLSDPSGPAHHWAGLLLSLQRCSVLWHTCVVILHVSLHDSYSLSTQVSTYIPSWDKPYPT